jgi:hypothetical protein
VYFTLGMNVPANVSVLSTCTCRERTIQTPESFKEASPSSFYAPWQLNHACTTTMN